MQVVKDQEGEKFLNVQLYQIYYVLKNLVIREPQSFQQGDVINYKSVQETKLKPYLTQIDNTGKKDRKWLWLYQHTQDQLPFVNFNFDTYKTDSQKR